MKKNILTLLTLCLCVGMSLQPMQTFAATLPMPAETVSNDRPKVRFSFDAYANHPKVQRTYVSQEMLSAALASGTLKNGTWDITHIVQRLTSLLSLHTHSRSTSQMMRSTMEQLSKKKQYELLMQTQAKNAEIVAFCHRAGRDKIDEIVVFRFRDGYCGRIIQITGDLRSEDVLRLMKLKSGNTSEILPEGNVDFLSEQLAESAMRRAEAQSADELWKAYIRNMLPQ